MKIQLEKKTDSFEFTAVNEQGNTVVMDASSAIGGTNSGVRPMEMLIMALGGCSGIDVTSILNKQKFSGYGLKIFLEAEREKGKEPSLFTDIHVRFEASGELEPEKLIRAVQLSMEKYCSVSRTLEKTAKITWSVVLNGEKL